MKKPTSTKKQAKEYQLSGLEATVIGSVVANPKAYRQIRDIVRAEMFTSEEGIAIAPILLDYLHEAGVDGFSRAIFEAKIPAEMLVSLHAAVRAMSDASGAKDAAELIAANWQDAEYRSALTTVALGNFPTWQEADAVLQETKSRIRGKAEKNQTSADILDEVVGDIWDGLLGKKTHNGISTGFPELDEMTGGWQPAQQIVIGGRPGMGKTRFAVSQCLQAAKQGVPALYFSKEQSAHAIFRLALAYMSHASTKDMKTYNLTTYELDDITDAKRLLASWPFYVVDNVFTIEDMIYTIADYHDRCGVKIFAVDYLQKFRKQSGGWQENRNNELSDMSSRIQEMAMKIDGVALVLSQLSRKVEERPGKRPQDGDLRDSGAIEADADVIIFPFNPKHYAPDSVESAELIVAKHRDGETGTIPVEWKSPGFYYPAQASAISYPSFDPSLNGKLRPAPSSDGGPNVITRPGSRNDDDEIPF